MQNEIFRKKSLDKINSPEVLNDYIRAANPGVWLLLAAMIILLVGCCIWGVFGYVETDIAAEAVVSGGIAVCSAADEKLELGMPVRIEGREYPITDVSFSGSSGNLLCTVSAVTSTSECSPVRAHPPSSMRRDSSSPIASPAV